MQNLFERARTKIVATVGPACIEQEQMVSLVAAGVDVFRLNMAHASLEEHTRTLGKIRQVSRQTGRPLAVLVDLAGPKIRLGELPDGMIECAAGDEFRFTRRPMPGTSVDISTTYKPLVDELQVGNTVLLADGTVSMKVVAKGPDFAAVRVVQPGVIRSRQGLNLPGVKLSAPALGEADREHALWAAKNDIDFVGLSFVRHPSDVWELKSLIEEQGSAARVIAKIEKQEAIDHLDGILQEADAAMVARGDLGVEIDVAQMPLVQKRIVAQCNEQQKPVIVATQMLDSMQHSRLPTRAEVTDVANAILDGADACMLSGETAIGKFPRESVVMMEKIARATEELFRNNMPLPPGNFRAEGLHPITAAVVHGAAHIALEIDARLLVVASRSGATALAVSKQRNYIRTLGVSDVPGTLRQMCLQWGVFPVAEIPIWEGDNRQILEAVTAWGRNQGALAAGDHFVLVAGIGLQGGSHNQVTVQRVD